MAKVERCISCGEVIPEGVMVCPNCLGAAKEMEIRKKHKKHWTTALKDIWCNFLCGWIVGMAIVGHWFMGFLTVYIATDGNVINGWFQVAIALASAALTIGILRYLGRGGK